MISAAIPAAHGLAPALPTRSAQRKVQTQAARKTLVVKAAVDGQPQKLSAAATLGLALFATGADAAQAAGAVPVALDETLVLGGAAVAALALTAVVKGDAFVVKGKAKEVYAPRGNPKPQYERKVVSGNKKSTLTIKRTPVAATRAAAKKAKAPRASSGGSTNLGAAAALFAIAAATGIGAIGFVDNFGKNKPTPPPKKQPVEVPVVTRAAPMPPAPPAPPVKVEKPAPKEKPPPPAPVVKKTPPPAPTPPPPPPPAPKPVEVAKPPPPAPAVQPAPAAAEAGSDTSLLVFGGALVALAAVFSLNEEGLMPEDATRGKAVPGTEPTPEARAASAAKWIANWRSKLPLITDVEQREVREVVQSSGSARPSGTIPGTEATPEARASSASDWIANWRSKSSVIPGTEATPEARAASAAAWIKNWRSKQ